MKYSGIGGQAVLEGVMMKNRSEYSVAVRKPDGGIEVKKGTSESLRQRSKLADIPIVRGVVTFVESLMMGMKALNYSASFYEEEEENDKDNGDAKESLLMGLLIVAAIVLAVGIFVVAPFLVSEALRRPIPSPQIRGLLEGVIRVTLFLLYIKIITLMEDIERVFMYHGAEHKVINCVESGEELTVENVRHQTTRHKRCGTSFLLIVMFVSILFFMFIVVGNMWIRMLFRILLIPVIAGLSYEFLRFAGQREDRVIDILSKPGLLLQKLTTAEPTDDMIEVAIASVEAVFDWREFIVSENLEEQPEETVQDVEILDVDDRDDEDDEILNALDRYFEDTTQEKEENKEEAKE